MWRWLIPAGLGAWYLLRDSVGGAGGTWSRGPVITSQIRDMVGSWAPRFGVRPGDMLAIGKIESGLRMDTRNNSEAAQSQGGAWGPFQMTQRTAAGLAAQLAKSKDPVIASVAKRWNGKGIQLTQDLELATVLSAAYLGNVSRMFGGSFKAIAAAYHQGAGKVATFTPAQREAFPVGLPPKGTIYVTRALEARKAYA